MSASRRKRTSSQTSRYVRFVPKADLCTAAEAPLFDHLVGAGKQRGRTSMQGVSAAAVSRHEIDLSIVSVESSRSGAPADRPSVLTEIRPFSTEARADPASKRLI